MLSRTSLAMLPCLRDLRAAFALQSPDPASRFTNVISAFSRGESTSACASISAGTSYHTSSISAAGAASSSGETISVTYVDKEGKDHTVQAPIGKNLLEVAHDNEIDLEGACEASLACSTCHVIVENPEYFKKIPEASDDELDMLDLAFGLTETSRLGCQVIAAKELDGIRVRIPAASRNFYVDGHKPKPH